MADRPTPERRPDEPLVDAAHRVAIDAVYFERDHGGTMHTAGEAAADAVLALLEPLDEHLVDLDDKGFTVTHPLTERFEGALHRCGLHRWLSAQDAPPAEPGRYRAHRHEPDTYSEDYRADAWELERIGSPAAGGGS